MTMNKLPKPVSRKRDEVLEKEKDWNEVLDGSNYWDEWINKLNKYDRARYSFVKLCIRYRLPYEQIGELIGITKARVYQLQRYGLTGKTTLGQRKEIRERDGNMCLICRMKDKYEGYLHVHHIGDPKDNSSSNLITLCPSCHKKTDAAKRRRNLTKV